jgi:sugar phosphate isomerase/epimerase
MVGRGKKKKRMGYLIHLTLADKNRRHAMPFRRCKPILFALLLSSSLAQAAAPAPASAPHIGIQLWSVKDDLKQDFEGTLGKLAAMGFQGVEFAGEFGRFATDPAGLRAFLDGQKLQCAGAHLDFAALADERFRQTVAFYQAVGCRNLVIAWDKRGASNEGAAAIARELALLAGKLKPLGMRIGYHNHAQEMTGPDGRTPWDTIAGGTPQAAILQQDIGWTVFAGKDPVTLIRRYPGRTVSAHFKAKLAEGAQGKPLIGQDRTDWPAVYAAARGEGGAAWIVLEQEEYPDGMRPLEAVAASMRALQAVTGNSYAQTH